MGFEVGGEVDPDCDLEKGVPFGPLPPLKFCAHSKRRDTASRTELRAWDAGVPAGGVPRVEPMSAPGQENAAVLKV